MFTSSFYGFTTAMMGLRASQKSLDIAGHNIVNKDTEGYTRQRLRRTSFYPGGFMDKYENRNFHRHGQGVFINGVEQIRDKFLDVKLRIEAAKLGTESGRLEALDALSGVYDELQKDGLNTAINDLISKLQNMANKAGSPEFESIVKSSAAIFTRLMNQYAHDMSNVRKTQMYNFKEIGEKRVNDILKSISSLNTSIMNSQLHGKEPLELLDQRNLLLDELSEYVDIRVEYNKVEVSKGVIIEEPTVYLNNADRNVLVKNTAGRAGNPAQSVVANFEVIENPGNPTQLKLTTTTRTYGQPTTVTNQMLADAKVPHGKFRAFLDVLNKSGEHDNPKTDFRGIGFYEKTLDVIANKFATELNALNTTAGGVNKPLFSSGIGGGAITAANIQISDQWKSAGTGYIVRTTAPNGGAGATDNLMRIIAKLSEEIEFETANGDALFKGSFHQSLSQLGNILALENSSAQKIRDNYFEIFNSYMETRDSISGVSHDEEGIDLIQYNKAYSAAARVMTTLDEALDTIINKMGIVGR